MPLASSGLPLPYFYCLTVTNAINSCLFNAGKSSTVALFDRLDMTWNLAWLTIFISFSVVSLQDHPSCQQHSQRLERGIGIASII
jgi:hypothetical protein